MCQFDELHLQIINAIFGRNEAKSQGLMLTAVCIHHLEAGLTRECQRPDLWGVGVSSDPRQPVRQGQVW